MKRAVVGFHVDADGDWVADLACLHGMHVRHRPPFELRPWVLTEAGRQSRVGAEVDCVLCDRCELPAGLRLARTAGPFDATTIPRGLRRQHRIAERCWAVVRVLHGSVTVSLDAQPPFVRPLHAGEAQALPPGVPHALHVEGPVQLTLDFLVPEIEALQQDSGNAPPA